MFQSQLRFPWSPLQSQPKQPFSVLKKLRWLRRAAAAKQHKLLTALIQSTNTHMQISQWGGFYLHYILCLWDQMELPLLGCSNPLPLQQFKTYHPAIAGNPKSPTYVKDVKMEDMATTTFVFLGPQQFFVGGALSGSDWLSTPSIDQAEPFKLLSGFP